MFEEWEGFTEHMMKSPRQEWKRLLGWVAAHPLRGESGHNAARIPREHDALMEHLHVRQWVECDPGSGRLPSGVS